MYPTRVVPLFSVLPHIAHRPCVSYVYAQPMPLLSWAQPKFCHWGPSRYRSSARKVSYETCTTLHFEAGFASCPPLSQEYAPAESLLYTLHPGGAEWRKTIRTRKDRRSSGQRLIQAKFEVLGQLHYVTKIKISPR